MSPLTSFQVAAFLLVLLDCQALDVVLRGITCNDTLPVNVTYLSMNCQGDEICTFGEEATFNGEFSFEGVEDSGVLDDTAYITSNLKFVSLDYHLFEFMAVQLCNEDLVVADESNENGDCPADGKYMFRTTYTLPTYDEKTSWLATGWKSEGEIAMYATQDTQTLIGYCTLDINPQVTKTNQGFHPPSAAATAGIIAGVAALALLICLYCSCRDTCKKKDDDASDDHSSFKRMDDTVADTSSQLSGYSSASKRMDPPAAAPEIPSPTPENAEEV